MQLNKSDRDLLWKAIKSRYLEDCRKRDEKPVDQLSESFFGYGNYDPVKELARYKLAPTIKRFMIEAGVLTKKNAERFSTQHLYKKFVLESPPVKIKPDALAYCLEYVGYPGDFKAFRKAYQERLQQELTYYRGFCFSQTRGRVHEFSFCCDLLHGPPYDVQQWRLHKRQEDDEDMLYSGTATRKRSFLYVQMENELQIRHLYMVLYTGAGDFKNLPFLFGTFSGVSNDDEPMAGECILVKSNRNKVISVNSMQRPAGLLPEEEIESRQAIHFLMLRRNHFETLAKIPVDREAFGKICAYTEEVRELSGIYRVINYTRRGNLVISWLEIKENMEGSLRTRFDGRVRKREVLQRCEFQLEHYQAYSYLHVSGYLEEHIHNYAIYDLNYFRHEKGLEEVLLGVFCSCSTNGRALSREYMVANKVAQAGETSQIGSYLSERIKKDQIDELALQDPLLAKMLIKLKELSGMEQR